MVRPERKTSCCLFTALCPESLKTNFVLAGLLTCPILEAFPSATDSGIWSSRTIERGTHSSGSVQDLHLIPFSPSFFRVKNTAPKRGKITKSSRNANFCRLFFHIFPIRRQGSMHEKTMPVLSGARKATPQRTGFQGWRNGKTVQASSSLLLMSSMTSGSSAMVSTT